MWNFLGECFCEYEWTSCWKDLGLHLYIMLHWHLLSPSGRSSPAVSLLAVKDMLLVMLIVQDLHMLGFVNGLWGIWISISRCGYFLLVNVADHNLALRLLILAKFESSIACVLLRVAKSVILFYKNFRWLLKTEKPWLTVEAKSHQCHNYR